MGVGDEGFIQFGALLQFWGFLRYQNLGEGQSTSTTLRVRRAELKVSGQILRDLVAYKVMIDPAKVLEFGSESIEVEGQEPLPDEPGSVTVDQPVSNVSVFQDFFITFLTDYADVSLGQFKNGMSYEGSNSSSKLILPERAAASRAYGDERDLGISVSKHFERFRYFLGLFNGPGLNRLDANNQKDMALRLEAFPLEGLMLGGVGYLSVGQRDEPTTKDRVEVDARVDIANILVQGEYLHAWDGSTDTQRTEGHGFYAALGYTFLDVVQPVFRVGFLDEDLDTADDSLWHYDLGANYFILNNQAKLAGSVSLFDFEDANTPTRTDVILAAQVSY